MKIDTSPTLENLLESKKQILRMLGNPYCDHLMFQDLNEKLSVTEELIKKQIK
jgi:hypothetical protein